MGAGRIPSRSNTSQPGLDDRADYFGPDKFAEASRERATSRERANRMNPSQPGLDDRADYFDLDKFNRLKAEVDQQRSRNNSGIAFGPGRSNRGNFDLSRQLQNRRQRR